MAIVVNTNVSSLISQRYLNNASTRVTDSLQKLSTGMKINSAADDAAGLYISKGIESQISGSKVCQSNIQIGINTMQIAEGDLSVIQDNLIRIKDLATQAASGTLSTASRNALRDEVTQRAAEINRIAGASEFNGIKLLDGSNQELNTKGLRIQVGAFAESTTNSISISGVFNNSEVSSLGLVKGSNGTSQATFTTIASAFANASTAAQFIADCEKAVTDVDFKVTADLFTDGKLLVQKGKKTFHNVILK